MGQAVVLGTGLDEGAQMDWGDVPLERLETELTTMAGHIAAASAKWLEWLAAYDRREGYLVWECRSAAQWLNWNCAMSLPAGREKVRVARALESLPSIRAAMARGELSYSKVRAITRVANVDNEPDMLSLALDSSASQLDRIVAGIDVSKRRMEMDEAKAFTERRLSSRSNGDHTATITMTGPVEMIERVLMGVQARLDQMIDDAALPGQPRREAIAERDGIAALRADALVDLATGTHAEFAPAAVSLVVDAATLAGNDDGDGSERAGVCQIEGNAVSAHTARRVACDAALDTVVVDGEGTELSSTNQARTPNRAQRRALARRDHSMCRFPGCGTTQRLHAHHVLHYANGGPTEVENLILVCPFHHHSLHEGGWNARAVANGGFEFVMPNGQVADIGRSRGSVRGLRAHTAGVDIGPGTIGPRSRSRLQEMSWLTSNFIHNEQNRRTRRIAAEPQPGENTPAGASAVVA